jgi:ribosomal protein S1
MADKKEVTLFEELLEKSPEIKYPKINEIVSGTVIKVEKKNILVDLNGQFTGLVIGRELGNTVDLSAIKPGQAIDVMIL